MDISKVLFERSCLSSIDSFTKTDFVANVLLVAERRSRLSEVDANVFVSRIQEMSIEEEPIPASEVLNKTRLLAARYGLSAYDAAYLELAMRLHIPLGTLDTKLAQAAKAAGVELALPDAPPKF